MPLDKGIVNNRNNQYCEKDYKKYQNNLSTKQKKNHLKKHYKMFCRNNTFETSISKPLKQNMFKNIMYIIETKTNTILCYKNGTNNILIFVSHSIFLSIFLTLQNDLKTVIYTKTNSGTDLHNFFTTFRNSIVDVYFNFTFTQLTPYPPQLFFLMYILKRTFLSENLTHSQNYQVFQAQILRYCPQIAFQKLCLANRC
jgi:hypothetical protein